MITITKLIFVGPVKKEYFSLKPLYIESKKMNLNTRLLKIHKSKIRNRFNFSNLSNYIVISHDQGSQKSKKIWMGWTLYLH